MRHLFFIFVLLTTAMLVSAQKAPNKLNKGEGTISFKGYDAFGDHSYHIDIHLKKGLAKIVYAYKDSIRFSDVRKDIKYIQFRLERQKGGLDDPTPRWFVDSTAKLFEKHSAYTRDSIVINLKKDKDYANLLERFSNATKEELAPKIERNWLDGYSVIVAINNTGKNLDVYVDTPHPKTHPLLIRMVANTLGKRKDSDAVKKILSFYDDFK